MDTALRRRCQLGAVLGLLSLFFAAISAQAQTRAPPAWQTELNAARALSAAAALGGAPAEKQAAVSKVYRELAAKYPREWEVQQSCGDYFWQEGENEQALLAWRKAQKLAPDNPVTADSIGTAFLRLGRFKEASDNFQRAIDADPKNALYRFELANVLALFRHQLAIAPEPEGSEAVLTRALEEYRRAAELAASDRRLAQAYAETFYMLAKPDWNAAIGAWLAVRALSGEATDFANSHLARISLKQGRLKEAREYLALLKDPAFNALKDKLNANANRLPQSTAGK